LHSGVGDLGVVLVWTFYLLPERREGEERGSNRRTRYEQEEATGATVPYRTERQEGGSYAKPERERAVKDKTEQSVLQQRKREKRGRGERSRAGPQMPSLVVVDDVS
jgi:hypothetical protein